jgi:hypothetical protein
MPKITQESKMKRTRSQNATGTKKHKAERCAASEAISAMTDNGRGKILLTMADGWETVLPKHGDDDPGVLIMWDYDNLALTVTRFNNAVAGGGIAPACLGPHPFTIPGLQMALLTHIQTTGGGGGVVGNALIAPNNITQYRNVCTAARDVGFEPFVRANAVPPIGRFYLLADRKVPATATRDGMIPPPAALGVPLFE